MSPASERIVYHPGHSVQDERDPLLGSVVAGRFKLVRRLASTEMSVVYCAEGEHGLVALKLLHAATDATADRCMREARAMARVRNAHVVQAIEHGRVPGQYVFIVMEYLDGESLAETLDREGPLPWRRVVHLARQLAEALAATHAEGIIHRDIKPSNCMRIERGGDPDFITLLDFGISKSVDERFATKTSTGAILGTPAYMAPELSATGSPDIASDIYSLGATLYHLVTGRVPFVGETSVDYYFHHQFTPLISPLERDPESDLPEAFDRLIVRALAKSPADRFPSVTEMVHALDQLLPTSERPSPLRLVAREPSTDEIATTEKPVDTRAGHSPTLGADEVRAIHREAEAATRGAATSRIAATQTFRGIPSGPSDILTPSSGAEATPLVTEALRTASDVETPLGTFDVLMRGVVLLCMVAVVGTAWHSLAPGDAAVSTVDGDGLVVTAPPPLRPLPGALAAPLVASRAPVKPAVPVEPPTPAIVDAATTAELPVTPPDPESSAAEVAVTPPDPSPFPADVPVTEPDPPAAEEDDPAPAPASAPFPRREAQTLARPALTSIRSCAEKSKLWGVLKLSVQVDEVGGIRRVRVRDPKDAPSTFVHCAEKSLAGIVFPAHTGGGSFDLSVDVSVFLPMGKK